MKQLLLCSLVFCRLLSAQNCDAPVVDDARVLNLPIVQSAVDSLSAVGADVRIRVYQSLGSFATLDRLKAYTQAQCTSWQAPDGGMKNNLVVLAVAVKDHKVGTYYGSQWKLALDGRYNQIETDQIKPRFRDRDFTGGFVAGMQAIGQALVEPDKITSAPAVIVQQQASDLSGLWTFLGWLLWLSLGGLAIWGIFAFLAGRSAQKEALSSAKQKAIMIQQQIVGLIARLGADFSAFEITCLDKSIVTKARNLLDSASSRYSALKQSSTADPNQEGLTAGEYASIGESYQYILNDLQKVEYWMKNGKEDIRPYSGYQPRPPYSGYQPRPKVKHEFTRPTPAQPQSQANVYVNQSDPLTDILLINALENERRNAPSKSDDGGGSSDWGSSSSSSGGSSDWGSSSSDSGSSSDFGSSDSGGGGSSDF